MIIDGAHSKLVLLHERGVDPDVIALRDSFEARSTDIGRELGVVSYTDTGPDWDKGDDGYRNDLRGADFLLIQRGLVAPPSLAVRSLLTAALGQVGMCIGVYNKNYTVDRLTPLAAFGITGGRTV
jgi:hypothetical protein